MEELRTLGIQHAGERDVRRRPDEVVATHDALYRLQNAVAVQIGAHRFLVDRGQRRLVEVLKRHLEKREVGHVDIVATACRPRWS